MPHPYNEYHSMRIYIMYIYSDRKSQ
jgi:hypothetical protein